LSGFNAFAAAINLVTFDGCTFKSNGKSGYNGANLWGSAKLINTNLVFDGSATYEWIDACSGDKEYEFQSCNINGGTIFNTTYITARNAGTKIKIDGVQYEWAEGGYFATDGKAVVTNAAALTAALNAKAADIVLMPGRYEGAFRPLVATNFTSASAEKAVIAGRIDFDSYTAGSSVENIKFAITDESKVKYALSGSTNYQYPSTVNIKAAAVSFEGCEFETSYASAVCGINYGSHAIDQMLSVNNCKFVGDFYAIRSRTLFSVTNSVFDIFTNQGTLAAVFTWGNGEAGTQGDSGANSVVFTGNENINANQIRSAQLSSTTFNYCHINYNVQQNDNFLAFPDGVRPGLDFTGKTFSDGSETF
jgi:hypothetical protein